jgi:CHAT domain-containing protein
LSSARRAATELSLALLQPAAPWLERKRLVVSAPDLLQGIPFGVLPDPRMPDSPGEREKWPPPLLLNHEIVKIPSLSVLAALRGREAERQPAPGFLALLTDPVFEAADERLGNHAVPTAPDRSPADLGSPLGSFVRLRNAAAEAEAILGVTRWHGVLAVVGLDANRRFVLDGNLRSFRNLHFTTHGRLHTQDADLSALVLSQFDAQGRPIDGLLRASDVVRLDLPADLVVLSACETGLGTKILGEGLVGLPQAFMAAGASRVLVSLWPVDDLASSKLMSRFYQGYAAAGRSPAAAHREAQIAMWRMQRYEAPFFWGAFELQGDWRPAGPPR